MQKKRSFYILLGATVVMVAAAVLSQRPVNEYTASHGLHAPELGDRADAIQQIVVRSADSELRLARTGDGWVARNKNDYPANAARIRELVVGLGRLERLEKKTSDPERLARLELTDVDEPGSKAVEVTLLSGDDTELASIMVGKTEDFQSTDYSRYFVRDAGDPQSWLVRGTLPPVLEDPGNWLQQRLLAGVEASGFQSIEITHPGGETVTVRRDSSDREDFELVGLSSGESVDSQYPVNQIADTLKRLSLKDVLDANSMEDKEAVVSVDALTFNGVRITARFDRREPDYGVTLSAAYEPEHDGGDSESDRGNAGAAEDETEEQSGNDEAKGEARNGDTVDGEQLAEDLNERWRDRLFVISQYSVDALMVKHSDLVKTAEGSGEEAANPD